MFLSLGELIVKQKGSSAKKVAALMDWGEDVDCGTNVPVKKT
jgi:hypothetical protein